MNADAKTGNGTCGHYAASPNAEGEFLCDLTGRACPYERFGDGRWTLPAECAEKCPLPACAGGDAMPEAKEVLRLAREFAEHCAGCAEQNADCTFSGCGGNGNPCEHLVAHLKLAYLFNRISMLGAVSSRCNIVRI